MNYIALFREYLVWHYSRALRDIIGISWNYLWFANHLFSVPIVLKTLLSPWKRLQEKKVNIMVDPQGFLANMTVNLIMRIVGILVRLIILLIAFSMFAFILLFSIFFFVLWLVLPLLVVQMLLFSVNFLFQ